jgi:hypothetical protein
MKSPSRLATISVGFVIVWCFGYSVGKGRRQQSVEGNQRTDTAHAHSNSNPVSPNTFASLVQAPSEFRRKSNLALYAETLSATEMPGDLCTQKRRKPQPPFDDWREAQGVKPKLRTY